MDFWIRNQVFLSYVAIKLLHYLIKNLMCNNAFVCKNFDWNFTRSSVDIFRLSFLSNYPLDISISSDKKLSKKPENVLLTMSVANWIKGNEKLRSLVGNIPQKRQAGVTKNFSFDNYPTFKLNWSVFLTRIGYLRAKKLIFLIVSLV